MTTSPTVRRLNRLIPAATLTVSIFVLIQAHYKITQQQANKPGNHTQLTLSLVPNRTLEQYFLVFVIPSKPSHTGLRNAIRSTWANITSWSHVGSTWANITSWSHSLSNVEEHYKKIKVMFIFGSEHDYEAEFEAELASHPDDMFVVDKMLENHRTSLKFKVLSYYTQQQVATNTVI